MATSVSSCVRVALGCTLAALPLGVGAPGWAADYTFKTIFVNAGNFRFDTLGAGQRSINDSGEVAFQASEFFSHTVYKGSGGPLTTIASSSEFNGLNFDTATIDDDGRVVFRGTILPNTDGIYRGSGGGGVGGGGTQIAIGFTNPGVDAPTTLYSAPSTSPSGIVAFRGARRDFPDQQPDEINSGYYLVTGPSTYTILAEDGGTYPASGSAAPVINDAGQVAFTMRPGGTSDILRYDNGSLTTIATGFSGGEEIWMNAAGDVIFADATTVKRYSGGVTTTVASTADGFHSLIHSGDADVYLNDSGDVAFWGNVETFNGNPVTWEGIYTGTDIENDRVLVRGDSLLGHVAGPIELMGLNNSGQILFNVQAESPDPWYALVVATPMQEADFDEDGDVDGDDLTRWRNNFGTGTTHMTGDADDDGDADGADFLTWQRQSGSPSSVAATAAVPEPAAAVLLMLSVTAVVAGARAAETRSLSGLVR